MDGGAPPRHIRRLADEDDASAIDRWVEEATGGEFRSLSVVVDAATLSLPISLLTLRTRWIHPFESCEPPGERRLEDGPWIGLPILWLDQVSRDLGRVAVGEGPAGPATVLRVEGSDDVDVYLILGAASAVSGAVLEAGIRALGGSLPLTPGSQLPDGAAGSGVKVTTVESSGTRGSLHVTTATFELRASHDLLTDGLLFASRPSPHGAATSRGSPTSR